jgi:fermentation-respiration switch protein FrsA (DUF1100 family)
VLAYDYHGYGASAGKPSERATYLDIDAAYEYLTTSKGIPPERIVLFGHSLGGGPSVDLAARRPIGGLILDSAFTSAFRAVTQVPILPFDKFRNIAKIRRVRAPVLVMHGTADRVVPFRQGTALYRAAGEPKSRLWVVQGGHEGLYRASDGEYRSAVNGFCEGLERGR